MNTPPPLFSKREKYSLAMFSVGFVAFSCVVHLMAGSMGYSFVPRFTVEPTPSPPPFYLLPSARRTPKPTPTPHATPTPPPPPKVTQPRVPAVHPPNIVVRPNRTVGPTEPPDVQPTPGVVEPSAPPVVPSAAPVATSTPSGPVVIRDSTFKYKAPLEYPLYEIQARIEGTVVVLVTIGPDGNVLSASVSTTSGNAHLDEAALKAARASSYTSYYVGGVAVEQQYLIVYEFRLDE
ncbi:MAG TPA: energy transducer TonB [Candidatus Eremiobacteraceae bacterium]